MKLLTTETETCVIDKATLIAPTKVSLPCTFPPENKTWNLHGATLVCSQEGGPARFPGATATPPWKRNKIPATTYRFQEEDAADGTSCALFGPCKNTRRFPSSETEHSTINAGAENCTNRTKKEEDFTTRLSPSSLCPVSFI